MGAFVINRTFSPDYEMPFVVAHKDTGAFVQVLVEAPAGTDLLGASEHMTLPEWTKVSRIMKPLIQRTGF